MEISQDIPVCDTNSAAQPAVEPNNKTTGKDTDNTTEKTYSTSSEPLLQHELDRIKTQRVAFHFANPSECYFNRHVPLHWFTTLLHCFFLVASILAITSTVLLLLQTPDDLKMVQGIGVVSDITLIDIFYIGLMFYLIGFGIKNLIAKTKTLKGQSYRIAMLCNAFSYIVINHLKLIFYIISLFSITALFREIHIDDAMSYVTEGAFADTFNALQGVISLTIFYRGFRHSYQGVEL